MNPETQTIVALAIVALTVAALVYAKFFRKRQTPGCGGACGSVSPEVKALRRRLRD